MYDSNQTILFYKALTIAEYVYNVYPNKCKTIGFGQGDQAHWFTFTPI